MMEKETYIVLRGMDMPGMGESFAGGLLGPPAAAAAPEMLAGARVETVEVDEQDIQAMRRDRSFIAQAPAIPVQLIKPVSAPGEAAEPEAVERATWGVFVTGATQSPYTGDGVTVAVLDTGIDAGHEAFAGVTLIEEDFTGEGNGDGNGHGTHVAGTIFGQPKDGLRFSVAPGIRRALIGKVLGAEGGGSTDQIFAAIQWAIDNGAVIINMSLGMDFPGYVARLTAAGWPTNLATSRALKAYRDNVRLFDAVVAMYRRRAAMAAESALLVAAAGNESKRDVDPNYMIDVAPPAAADGIVSVAALATPGAPHSALTVASFSNINPQVSGPGAAIYSAKAGGGYRYLNGTSMASPHVAGIAALWAQWQLNRPGGRIDFNMINAKLLGGASGERLADPNDVVSTGAGLVQAPTV